MSIIPRDYLERVYSGWLGKIIGIRLGAPIEGWDYWRIKEVFGEIDSYPVDYREFAADDDSNGPLFFLRALENASDPGNMQPQDVAQALLNYAPFEHGFFWWGGYGISTEHTAYLNLRSGIPAPRSGSIEQNGAAVAEQIGGQIFIDTWGLVAPGQPELAARLARSAASVMHGGNGVYGGIFVAVCISLAFVETDIRNVIEKALGYIPDDCEYARVVRAVIAYFEEHADKDWRSCFEYIWNNFGYDRYPGHCHIIPNAAVMILSMLYGGGDFDRTINICNMCGWDTDCNVGNVGTIMGVLVGIDGINYDKWIRPVHDLLICSGVVGSLNIMDIPYGASYIARWAYRLANEEMPSSMAEILERSIDGCHFEYPISTHSLYVRKNSGNIEAYMRNTCEQARTGRRSLKVTIPGVKSCEKVYIAKRTYYTPEDFYDSRYDPSFSPTVYPGQTMHASIMLDENSSTVRACLFVREAHSGKIFTSDSLECEKGKWADLCFAIPAMQGGLIDEAGICLYAPGIVDQGMLNMCMYVDDLYFDGNPDYAVDLAKEKVETWTSYHTEVSQFTRLKGLMYLEDGALHLSCHDFAEAYTGRHDWKNYETSFEICVQQGTQAYVNFRVQGAMRSYAAGFNGKGKLALLKNYNGYSCLAETDIEWKQNEIYTISITAKECELKVACGNAVIVFRDETSPWLEGGVGVSVQNGSHICLKRISVKGI